MTNRLALVTGANGNLGSKVVAQLRAAGDRVAEVGRSNIVVDGASIAEIDLASRESTQRAFGEVARRFGPLDAVVHTVGVFRTGMPLTAENDRDFLDLFGTNVVTTLHVVQAALALMIPRNAGRVAAVASLEALSGSAGRAAYAASKAAQLRVMESAAADVKGTRITLNTVLPGTMDTPANRAAMPDADPTRWVTLDEVANVLTFLVSDLASGIHGQAIRVERS